MDKRIGLRSSALALSMMVLVGCVTASEVTEAPRPAETARALGGMDQLNIGASPPGLEGLSVPRLRLDGDEEIEALRRDSLQEMALSYGSQAGYARRAWDIERVLQERSPALSETFDFARVTIPAPRDVGMIVPPVVARAFTPFSVEDDGRAASAADEYLEVVAPARISPTVPTWRDYLLFDVGSPDMPPNALRPASDAEDRLFQQWLTEGWESGLELAEAAFDERLNRLHRDYEGMLEYRRLVANGMIDELVVADADFGVVAEADGSVMRIGERSVQIVDSARLIGNADRWRPIIVTPNARRMVDDGSIDPAAAPSRQRPQSPESF